MNVLRQEVSRERLENREPATERQYQSGDRQEKAAIGEERLQKGCGRLACISI
jgi:hypothetical protein